MNKNQGLIDMRSRVKEKADKFGMFSPYSISCEALINILNELEYWRNKAEEESKKAKRKRSFISNVNTAV